MSEEIRSTVRVYVKEYLFDSRHDTKPEARSRAVDAFGGRNDDEPTIHKSEFRSKPFEVWVKLWNLRGEFKDPADAERTAEGLRELHAHDDVQVVVRNSRAEHLLTQYGKVRTA